MHRPSFRSSTAALLLVALLGLAGCGNEPEPEASTAADTSTADVVNFPNPFPDVATKCDHGNRLYLARVGPPAIAVVPNDPTCPK